MVSCAECGFLGRRQNQTGRLREATEAFRERGWDGGGWHHYPYCAIRAENLGAECEERRPIELERRKAEGLEQVTVTIRSGGKETVEVQPYNSGGDVTDAVAYVIHSERDCRQYIEWHPGFSPQAHRRMLDQRWKEEQEDKRRKAERWWHLLEAALFILAGAGAAIIGGLVERGTIF